MSPIDHNHINITLQIFSLLLVVVLLVGMTKQRLTRKRRILVADMAFHVVALSGAIVARLSYRQPGTVFGLTLRWGVLLAYVFGVFTFVTLMGYICYDMSDKPIQEVRFSWTFKILQAINGINLAIIFTNPLHHAYFTFTNANSFNYGPCFWLYDLLILVQTALLTLVALKTRQGGEDLLTKRVVLCCVLMFCAAIGNIAFPRLALEYPTISLVFTLICVGVQGRLEQELERARADAAESRLRLLSGQIHPHFIFNSLAAIQALVAEDPTLAETAIHDFSDYLRSHLDAMSDLRLVPFSTELEHVRHYVALERADSMVPLEVRYDLATTDFMVPPLTVQPLVENAIRHGIRTREEGGVVEVSTSELEDRIEVRVRDDGRGLSSATARQDQRRQVGIENVRERLVRQCGGSLDVSSDAMGTTALVSIPKGEGHERARG